MQSEIHELGAKGGTIVGKPLHLLLCWLFFDTSVGPSLLGCKLRKELDTF
jgi:hypothetical protein